MLLFKNFLTVFFLIPFVFLGALEYNSSRIERLEKELDSLKENLHEMMIAQARPIANPDIMRDEWFVGIDILYWYQRTNGTAFAYIKHDRDPSLPLKGRTKDINFDWCGGWRVTLGKNLNFDKWDLSGAFVYYRNHVSGVAKTGQSSILMPLRGASITQTGVAHAKSTYHLHFRTIDAELGRHYYVSPQLSFRPFVGVKSAWLDQAQAIHYTGGSLCQNTAHVNDNCDYWGLGAKGGLNSRWHLGQGWHVDGLFSGALLYVFFDIEHIERVTPSKQYGVKLEDNKHHFVPMVQWRLGLNWGTYFNQKENYINLGATYEGMYWWRQNQMLKIYESKFLRYDNFSEDLSMHGLTFSVKLYF